MKGECYLKCLILLGQAVVGGASHDGNVILSEGTTLGQELKLLKVDLNDAKSDTFQLKLPDVTSISGTPTGRILLSSYFRQGVFELKNGKPLNPKETIFAGNISSVCFSPDSSKIAFIKDHEVWFTNSSLKLSRAASTSPVVRSMSPKYDRAYYQCSWLSNSTLLLSYLDPFKLNGPTLFVAPASSSGGKPKKLTTGCSAIGSFSGSLAFKPNTESDRIVICKERNGTIVSRFKSPPFKADTYCFNHAGTKLSMLTRDHEKSVLVIWDVVGAKVLKTIGLPRGNWGFVTWP